MSERPSIVDASLSIVKNKLPLKYPSTVGVFGGKIVEMPDGKMVYKTGRPADVLDVKGDSFLRKFDDHVIKEPFKMFSKHPKAFFQTVFNSEPMRRRGSPAEIAENIKRLGLSEYYGPHSKGIEIKNPEKFKNCIALADIYHADKINSPILNGINRFQALTEATKYISDIHNKYGPIGDIVGDILFQEKDGSKVINPVLNIPDIVLTPSKRRIALIKESLVKKGISSKEINKKTMETISKEQKAVDICELMISNAFEEFKLSNNPELVKETIKVITENYEDKNVLKLAKSFIKRGRHTLPDSQSGGILKTFFTFHNMAHLNAEKEHAKVVREIIVTQFDKSSSEESL